MATTDRQTCTYCGTNKRVSDFYKSNSIIYSYNKKLPICKNCIIDIFDDFSVKFKSEKIALYKLCRMLDVYYCDSNFDGAKSESLARNINFIGLFFKNANSLDQYKTKTFDDVNIEEQEVISNESIEYFKFDDKTYKKLIDKYGFGYTNEEYSAFENKYNKLIRNYSEQTAMHTEGLITYIRYRVKEEMATSEGNVKDAKDWGALATKAAQDAKINVSQLSKSDISGGVDLMTQLSEAIESKASVIPLLPKVLEQPYDDVDLVLWALLDYDRMLEDKPRIEYRDIWNFYDKRIEEYYSHKGYTDEQIENEKKKRNAIFRDLGEVYIEPLYEDDDV